MEIIKRFFVERKFAFQIFVVITVLDILDSIIKSHLSTNKEEWLATSFSLLQMVDASISIIFAVLVFVFLFLNKQRYLWWILILANAVMTFNLIDDVTTLIETLPRQKQGAVILVDAFLIWTTNLIVFTVWYWMLDRGGPLLRRSGQEISTKFDLVFPQEQHEIKGWEKWKPNLLDYLFFSFYSSMAFTPTDTLVLSRKMKFLLMIQAVISLVVLAMIAARAINIIGVSDTVFGSHG